MIKSFKIFENLNNENQPFYLNDSGRLYVSDEIVDKIIDKNISRYRTKWSIYTNYSVGFDTMSYKHTTYKMYITFHICESRKTEVGDFKYFIGGNCGDHTLWCDGKNCWGKRVGMIVAFQFICKLYPIFKYIKNGFKQLKEKKPFYDIIRESVYKNVELVKYGIPKELEKEIQEKLLESDPFNINIFKKYDIKLHNDLKDKYCDLDLGSELGTI